MAKISEFNHYEGFPVKHGVPQPRSQGLLPLSINLDGHADYFLQRDLILKMDCFQCKNDFLSIVNV